MPLVTTVSDFVLESSRRAIGFWMKQSSSQAPVRVFVTYHALTTLDPSQLEDAHAAIEIFTKNRTTIETAASKKFDANGVDDGKHEGQPILIIRADDLAE